MNFRKLFQNSPEEMEEFLLNCFSDMLEDPEKLPEMLADIAYLDNKEELLSEITECEILDVDEYSLEDYSVDGDTVHVQFSMVYILQAFKDSEYIWRVQGTALIEADIESDTEESDEEFDPEDYEDYMDAVHVRSMKFEDVECDTL